MDRSRMTLERMLMSLCIVFVVGCLFSFAVIVYLYKNANKSGGPCGRVSTVLDTIKSRARMYYLGDHWDSSGNLLPKAFPSNIKRTPLRLPCNGEVVPAETWKVNGWRTLSFSPLEETYCSHEFISHGTGAASGYTAKVECQWGCEEKKYAMEVEGRIGQDGLVKHRMKIIDCSSRLEKMVDRFLDWIGLLR